MNIITFFLYYIFPYITIILLILMSIYKIISWIKIPMNIKWPLNPVPKTKIRVITSLIRELVTFESQYKADDIFWFITILFHISILSVLPHIITFLSGSLILFDPLLMPLGTEYFLFIKWLDLWYTIAGSIAIITIIYFILRRLLVEEAKQISLIRDYFELIILLIIISLGVYMHVFKTVPVGEVLKYFSSLASFNPTMPPQNIIFTLHYILAQIYIIYFPYSRCFHVIGYVFNNWIIRKGVK